MARFPMCFAYRDFNTEADIRSSQREKFRQHMAELFSCMMVERPDVRYRHHNIGTRLQKLFEFMAGRSRQFLFLIPVFLGAVAAIGAGIATSIFIPANQTGGFALTKADTTSHKAERSSFTTVENTVGLAPNELSEAAKLLDSNPAIAAQLGFSVAISGETAIVGAPGEANNRGSTSIFVRNGSSWILQQEIVGADSVADDHFGWSVAISGETAVVGAYDLNEVDQGSAYVFVRNGTTWSQQQKLTPAGGTITDQFGSSVSISGETIIVGAFGRDNARGAAYVYFRNAGVWEQGQMLTASDGASGDEFGWSVDIIDDRVVIGAPADDSLRGSAYIFNRIGLTWSQVAKIVASDGAAFDRFGYSSAVDGTYLVIGSPLDSDGGILSGSAYVYSESGDIWQQRQKLLSSDRAANDKFGGSVAISGNSVVIGSNGDDIGNNVDQGSAYSFTRTESDWALTQKLTGTGGQAGDNFGGSVALGPGVMVAGSYLDDGDALLDAGSAYIFTDLIQSEPVVVAGRVLTPDGRGLRGAQVRITDVLLGTSITATTSTLGFFQFQVQNGRDYVINVASKRYRFSPTPISVNGDTSNIEMVGLE